MGGRRAVLMKGDLDAGDTGRRAQLVHDFGGRLDGNDFRDNAGHGIAVVTGAMTDLIANDVVGNREPQILEGALATAQGED